MLTQTREGDESGFSSSSRCAAVSGLPHCLAAAVRILSMKKRFSTSKSSSQRGSQQPQNPQRASAHQAESPGPDVSKSKPTPAERTHRTAGVTLLLPNPNCLQVPRALSKLALRAASPRGGCAPLRAHRALLSRASVGGGGGVGASRPSAAAAGGRLRSGRRTCSGVWAQCCAEEARLGFRDRGAGTMAAAPAPARVPAHLQYRVQLLFVTEEQLFGAGPLSPSTAKSLRLEVHPAGEEADATVTDDDGVCVFKCLLNKDTECCRVGKESILITLGYHSALLKFESHADDGVCVFKCLLNKDTECCRVGKESILITLGYHSALLKFESHAELSAFSNTLKRCQNEKKESSVFSQRTEEASAAQYFQFYGCISQQQNMMQDFVRTATYHRAILQNHTDFRDKVVLDVGCGSGILSFFAVQAGARRVYAVEASSVARYAEMLVKNNHLSEKIIVLPGKIEDISLPETVDVIISEPMGYMLFNERMLESYLHSKKWLKANGMMFPTFSDIHLAPFSDEQLYMEHYSRANFWYQQCFYGVNLSSLRGAAVDEYFRQPIVDTFDIRILMARTVKYTVNFIDTEEADLHRVEIPFVFQMLQSGLIHGLAFWFDVAFVGSLVTVWLSTAPTEPLTHWYQVRCLLQTPLFAKEGETLSGKVLFVANKRQSYGIQIMALVDQTGFRSGNILDLKNPFFRFA
nr:histone-arginine methyltransferase CARM1-like [Manis javanica]